MSKASAVGSTTRTIDRSDRLGRWARGTLIATGVLLVATLARVGQLKAAPSEALSAHLDPRTTTARRPAERGRVLDRRGQIVAMSVSTRRLFADPAFLYEQAWERHRRSTAADDPTANSLDPFAEVASELAGAAALDGIAIERALRDRADDRYLVLAPSLEPWQADAIAALRIPGVGLESRQTRIRPFGDLAAPIIGRVGWVGEGTEAREHAGQSGAEARLDRRLAHEDGRITYRRDARGRTLHVAAGDFAPPLDGEDVRLTIDMVVQEIAERNLAEAVERSNAGGGQLVVVDLVDGGILAVADILRTPRGRPGFDRDPLREQDASLARPRAVTDPYEPGSTFKPFVWAYATELGLARPDEELQTPSGAAMVLRHGRSARAIRDVRYYGPSTWRRVLVKSLNTGMAIVSQRMTARQMQDAVSAFGFGSPTACGLPGESGGLVTSPSDWKMLYTQVSVSFGQEIGVTAMQMVRAFAALCGDGTLPTLHLVMPESDAPHHAPRIAVSPATARLAREVMEEVMLDGTGRKARSEDYRIFGKSGTAQLPKPDGSGYFEDRYRSSFLGGAPFESPRLAVLCVIDDPDRTAVPDAYGGGALAGPVVRNVIDETLAYLGVEPDQPPKAN
ncbi:MAG: peptidoglycan D,D-transpeptidase FtsI family protein [Phycisphaerales bacterium]